MDTQNPVQPQNPVSQPVAPKPKSSKWTIIVIAVLILITVGCAAVYLLNQNLISKIQKTRTTVESTTIPTAIPAPIANWKTYTNTKHNFSIDYPDNWGFREFPDTKNGAGFNPLDKQGLPDASESISISAGQKIGNHADEAFEDYVKIAGTEIQNYNDLASLKKVTTADGIVGYETTWMVQPMTIGGQPPTGGDSESLPITYFELPGDKTSLVRVSLSKEEDLNIYEQMLITLKFTTSPVKLQATPTKTLTPTINEGVLLKTVIKEALAAKFGNDGSTLNITVSQIAGNYAKGQVSDQGGGGMWFAAKVNGVWKLVWDGNGVILCSDLSSYPDFPASMIPECYNEATQKTVQR